ncbi:hypothetical protein [Thermomonospora umbrina]|uniref:Uncharacterized protein n=1 Tax=Thermomonospora umbrina TaxID=111806 RepID=A0A3D9SRW2_9ACTN|nr:hypothetical protein [Thermomonospora umbrina]REE98706.1 hypothetical protein DFJ69_4199 [Thermomonospora umbrina]
MDGDEREAARLLGVLRDFTPEGPDTIDLGLARRVGRRRALTRRAVDATVLVVTVVALVAGSTLLGRALDGSDGSSPLTPSADQFGTRYPAFKVGSAGGFAPVGYENGRYVQRVFLRSVTRGESTETDGLIEIYVRGRLPEGARGRYPTGTAAEPVGGRRAVWPRAPLLRENATELAWEWSPGAWAFVSLRASRQAFERAHRVAQSVQPNGPSPAPVFTVPSPSGSVTPSFTGSPTATGPEFRPTKSLTSLPVPSVSESPAEP